MLRPSVVVRTWSRIRTRADALQHLTCAPHDLCTRLDDFFSYRASLLRPSRYDPSSPDSATLPRLTALQQTPLVIDAAWARVVDYGADVDIATVGHVCRATLELRSDIVASREFVEVVSRVVAVEAGRAVGADVAPAAIVCHNYVLKRGQAGVDIPLRKITDMLMENMLGSAAELHRDSSSLAWWVAVAARMDLFGACLSTRRGQGRYVGHSLHVALRQSDAAAFTVREASMVLGGLQVLRDKGTPVSTARRFLDRIAQHMKQDPSPALTDVSRFVRLCSDYPGDFLVPDDLEALRVFTSSDASPTLGADAAAPPLALHSAPEQLAHILLRILRLCDPQQPMRGASPAPRPRSVVDAIYRNVAVFVKVWRRGRAVDSSILAGFALEYAVCGNPSTRDVMVDMLRRCSSEFIDSAPAVATHLGRAALLPREAFQELFVDCQRTAPAHVPMYNVAHAVILLRVGCMRTQYAVRQTARDSESLSGLTAYAVRLVADTAEAVERSALWAPSRHARPSTSPKRHLILRGVVVHVRTLATQIARLHGHVGDGWGGSPARGAATAPLGEVVGRLLACVGRVAEAGALQHTADFLGLWSVAGGAAEVAGVVGNAWRSSFAAAAVGRHWAAPGAGMRVVWCYNLLQLLVLHVGWCIRTGGTGSAAVDLLVLVLDDILPASLTRKRAYHSADGDAAEAEHLTAALQAVVDVEAMTTGLSKSGRGHVVDILERGAGAVVCGDGVRRSCADHDGARFAGTVLRMVVDIHAQDFKSARRMLHALFETSGSYDRSRAYPRSVDVLLAACASGVRGYGDAYGRRGVVETLRPALRLLQKRGFVNSRAFCGLFEEGAAVLRRLFEEEGRGAGVDEWVRIAWLDVMSGERWDSTAVFRVLYRKAGHVVTTAMGSLPHCDALAVLSALTRHRLHLSRDPHHIILATAAHVVGPDNRTPTPRTQPNTSYISALTAFAQCNVRHPDLYARLESHCLQQQVRVRNPAAIAGAYARVAVVTTRLDGVVLRNSKSERSLPAPAESFDYCPVDEILEA